MTVGTTRRVPVQVSRHSQTRVGDRRYSTIASALPYLLHDFEAEQGALQGANHAADQYKVACPRGILHFLQGPCATRGYVTQRLGRLQVV